MESENDKLNKWLVAVIAGLVSNPDKVSVTSSEDEQGVLFVVTVSHDDVGKVIGKKGAIAQAVRTLLRSAGYLIDIRASMKVDAPGSTFELKREDGF